MSGALFSLDASFLDTPSRSVSSPEISSIKPGRWNVKEVVMPSIPHHASTTHLIETSYSDLDH